jgi:Ca-activated chloride channel family protein
MSFREPAYLAGLALLPLAMLLYAALQRRRAETAAAFASPSLMPNVVTGSPGWRRHVPAVLILIALGALVLALARPERTIAQPKRQATVVLVTDVSGSMSATDVEPDRLAAAQAAAKTFVEKVPDTFRIGVVTFNQYAELRLPPTAERSQIEPAIDSLVADGGTAMGDGLQRGLDAVESQLRTQRATGDRRSPAAIVLLSDGKNTAGQTSPLDAARRARELRVPIYAVALGTPEGTITLTDPGGFEQTIPVPPDPSTLKQLARLSQGRFFDAPSAEQLESVYETLGTRIGFEETKQEVSAAFAGGGLLLLVLSGAIGLRWFGRVV